MMRVRALSAAVVTGGLLFVPAALAAGLLDPTFGGGGVVTQAGGSSLAAGGVVVQPDGKVVVEGQELVSGTTWITVSRFLPSGAPDSCFGSPSCQGNGTIKVVKGQTYSGAALALQSDGRILAAGGIRKTPSSPFGVGVVRLNVDGSLDGTFAGGGTAVVSSCSEASAAAVTEASDGSVVLAGTATCAGVNRLAVVELTASGAPKSGFGTGGLALLSGPSTGYGVATQADGKVLVAGQTGTTKATYRCLVARLGPSGALDPGFGSGGVVQPASPGCVIDYNVAVLSSGDILASGAGFTNQVVISATRLLPTGTADGSFGSAGTALMNDGSVGSQTMAVQGDGRIVFGSTHGTVARMNANGTPDGTFGTAGVSSFSAPGSTSSAVNGVAASADGRRVYAAGATVISGRDELLVAALQG